MFNNLNSTLKKVLVVFLIITLTYANIALIGNNIMQGLFSYASEEIEKTPMVKSQELVMNKTYEEEGVQKRLIQVAVETGFEEKYYPIRQTTITLKKDIVDGKLVDVKVTELNRNSYTSGTWELTEDGKIIITLVNENDKLENTDSDKLLITYVYEESENDTIVKPVEKINMVTYSEETQSGAYVEASFEDTNVKKELYKVNVENKDIHKTTIESGKIDFEENLKVDLSYRNKLENISIEEIENNFYDINEQKIEDAILQYNKTVINKEVLNQLLGTEGKLIITDVKTNKTIAEITSKLLEKEEETEQKFKNEDDEEETRSKITVNEETVEIEYKIDVTNIKIELTNIREQEEGKIEFAELEIKNKKTISNINDVDSLNSLRKKIKYTIDAEKTLENKIIFKDTITKANLAVDNTTWTVGKANTVKYTVTLDTTSEKTELYKNPVFIIEMPSCVESINAENSEFTVTNDNDAFSSKNVFATSVLGRKYVVISLEGAQTEENRNENAKINLTLELNIAENEEEGNDTTKLYYQNNTVTAYESGKGFDTSEVTVDMIMNSEEKDNVGEYIAPDIIAILSANTGDMLSPEKEHKYNLYLYNFETEDITDLKIEDILPEGVTLSKVSGEDEEKEIDYTYNDETRLLTINLDKLEKSEVTEDNIPIGTMKHFIITVTVDNLEEGIYSKTIKNKVKVFNKENLVDESNEIENTIAVKGMIIEKDEMPEKMKENDKVKIAFKLTNKGIINVTGINVSLKNIPEEIELNKYKITTYSANGEEEGNEEGTIADGFEKNNLTLQANTTYYFQIEGTVGEFEKTKQISIEGNVNDEKIIWNVELEKEVEQPEEPSNPTEPVDPENPSEPQEPENPSEPEDPENPADPENPNNPSDSEKPDDNKEKEDIFDLSLVQYLNKVTVTNEKGTATYNYKDTNFAKVEIHSKQMNGSKVTLEYKIIVKNEGTIPGYARKIVDYIPKDLTFNQEQNSGWYVGDDGNIYSTELLDKILQPGETAELTVVLEKQMTNENVGTITTQAEIYEASNDQNVEDINSIPGDRLDGQNDISKVEVLIAISTGKLAIYIALAIVVVTILVIGFYKVKKVTLNKKGGC